MHGQHTSRCPLDALSQPRAAQPAGGVCPEVNILSMLDLKMGHLKKNRCLPVGVLYGAYLGYRRGHDVLRDQLPSKQEHVILVRLSPIQRALYAEFMKRFREAGNSGWLGLNPLKAFCVCCKVRLAVGRSAPFSPAYLPFPDNLFVHSFRLLKYCYKVSFYPSDPSRSGITQTSSMKLCRRRIRQMSRT